jgi:hypothetical protein
MQSAQAPSLARAAAGGGGTVSRPPGRQGPMRALRATRQHALTAAAPVLQDSGMPSRPHGGLQ